MTRLRPLEDVHSLNLNQSINLSLSLSLSLSRKRAACQLQRFYCWALGEKDDGNLIKDRDHEERNIPSFCSLESLEVAFS